jgi:mannose-6-phosphate isomerase-like protein (cupin superfamily)
MCDMPLIEKLTPDFVFDDERGTLAQLVHSGYEQVNAVFTKKGAVRGNMHCHKNSNEVFYIISGSVDVTARLDEAEETARFESGDMFLIRNNIMHTFVYNEDTYIVALYDRRIENEDGTKDIISAQ